MKKSAQRIVAIDYFRGLAILVVTINHAAAFTLPFAYLTGQSRLWTSAAAALFIISGLTFGVVRGPQIRQNFRTVMAKTLHRALYIYGIYIAATLASLALALTFVYHGLPTYFYPGGVPSEHIWQVVLGIFTLRYSFGWTSFLSYFVVFLALAPLLTYLLNNRRWIILPIASVGLYAITSVKGNVTGTDWFAIWQLYFVIGLVLGRFRMEISNWFYGLNRSTRRYLSAAAVSSAAVVMALSALVEFNFYHLINKLTDLSLIPRGSPSGYLYLKAHKTGFDSLLMQNRSAILRPLVALLVFFAIYIVYQKLKEPILKYTGSFMISLGQNTLWIFAAQGLVIPLLAVLPIPRTVMTNLMLTTALVGAMWLVTKRSSLIAQAKTYTTLGYESLVKLRYSLWLDSENS